MTKKWWYPTAFSTWDDREREAIERVVDSDRFTMGEEVEAFESELAAFHGRKHAIMVNSGSSANLIAVAALFHVDSNPLAIGDKVLAPAVAWATTYAPLMQHGMNLVLIDCDGSWNANSIAGGAAGYVGDPRLVIGCSILGNPAKLGGYEDFASEREAYLIEDNCESIGATIGGRLCGTFGDMSTLSFFWSHQLSAVEGGAVLTDNDELDSLCRMLRDHGMTRGLGPAESFETEYDFRCFGYNVRGVEMHAAIGRVQLKKLPAMLEVRRANLKLFRALVEDVPEITPPVLADKSVASPFGLHFRFEEPEQRRKAVGALRAVGIDCRLPTGGSFRRHAYGKSWAFAQRTPEADMIHDAGLFLGNAAVPLADHIGRAVNIIKEAIAR